MRFDVLTLFPEFFSATVKTSIMGRALEAGLVEINAHNIRDWARDRHKTTDDATYGGGHGMVMKAEPVALALEAVKAEAKTAPRVILTTPQGAAFNDGVARELALFERVVIICGRYEGFDERIRTLVDMEISIGDFVLTGGEIPALAIMDAAIRFLPGVLGADGSAEEDSFSTGLLEYPQYTRPEEWRGMKVPAELLSGNHALISSWRRREAIRRTALKRPDLLEKAIMTDDERRMADEFKREGKNEKGD
ncbi:MAG: tRNA (guanosine(37)-N1)-methyltransferase TrmD [Deltaproteobacteria bacterium]|nr:tRNA (guanosine(37)-N1)-methyltransferase TrmD [Deltaproteobacteria bacterium]